MRHDVMRDDVVQGQQRWKRVIGGIGWNEPGPSLFGGIPVPAAQQVPELGVVQDGMAAPDAGSPDAPASAVNKWYGSSSHHADQARSSPRSSTLTEWVNAPTAR